MGFLGIFGFPQDIAALQIIANMAEKSMWFYMGYALKIA